jgi:hypothetical protein
MTRFPRRPDQFIALTTRIPPRAQSKLRALAQRRGLSIYSLHQQILVSAIADLETEPQKAETPAP